MSSASFVKPPPSRSTPTSTRMTTAATSPASTPMKLTVEMMMIGGTSGVAWPAEIVPAERV